jgi:hypothetical protein
VPVWYEAPLEMNERTPSGPRVQKAALAAVLWTGPIERPLNLYVSIIIFNYEYEAIYNLDI